MKNLIDSIIQVHSILEVHLKLKLNNMHVKFQII